VEIAPQTTATVSAISRRRVTRVRVRVTEPGRAQISLPDVTVDGAEGDGAEDK
jgi:hypothetical protein